MVGRSVVVGGTVAEMLKGTGQKICLVDKMRKLKLKDQHHALKIGHFLREGVKNKLTF